jgi:T5orf172 domain
MLGATGRMKDHEPYENYRLLKRVDMDLLVEEMRACLGEPFADRILTTPEFAQFADFCGWDMKLRKVERFEGWVYVLRQREDRWFRNRCTKIGATSKDPEERAVGLCRTAVPRPLHVEFAAFVPNAAKLECDVHAALNKRLAPGKKEVFEVGLGEAIRTVLRCEAATRNSFGLYLVSDRALRAAGLSIRARCHPTGLRAKLFTERDGPKTVSIISDLVQELDNLAAARDRRRAGIRSGANRLARLSGLFGLGLSSIAAVGGAICLHRLDIPWGLSCVAAVLATGTIGFALGHVASTISGHLGFRADLKASSRRLLSTLLTDAEKPRSSPGQLYLAGLSRTAPLRAPGPH